MILTLCQADREEQMKTSEPGGNCGQSFSQAETQGLGVGQRWLEGVETSVG